MAGVVCEDGEILAADVIIVGLASCCSGRKADPRLGFNWNATHGLEQ